MAQVELTFCDSSFISAYGYQADDNEPFLRVRFKKDSAELDYLNVPQVEYDAMRVNARPGQYFRQHIYGHYQWRRA